MTIDPALRDAPAAGRASGSCSAPAAGRFASPRAPGRPHRPRWPGTRSTAARRAGAWPPSAAPGVSAGPAGPPARAVRSSSRCASRSHLRRPCELVRLRRQLIAARLPVELVLGGVDRLRLLEDLARDLLVIDVRVAAGVGSTFVPSIATTPTRASPACAQSPSTAPNRPASASSVALDEARDRRVIGPLLRRDHPERHVLLARPLDHPRGPRSRAHRRRATAPASSPAHRPAGRARPRGRPHRTPPYRSRSTASMTNHAR